MAAGGGPVIAVAVGAGLVVVAVALSRAHRLGLERELAVAAVRAAVQLAAVGLVIQAIFASLGWSGLLVAVMLGVAAWTAARRMAAVPGARWRAGLALAAAAAVTLPPLFAAGAFPLTPRYLVPLAGIVIGGGMKAASLAGLRLVEELADRGAELEVRLALGDSARQALRPALRRAVVAALVPALDQTKNAGLVTLPGAFVGMLLGGATPVEAATVQLVVLLALLGAETLAATTTAVLAARAFVRPGERIEVPARAG